MGNRSIKQAINNLVFKHYIIRILVVSFFPYLRWDWEGCRGWGWKTGRGKVGQLRGMG